MQKRRSELDLSTVLSITMVAICFQAISAMDRPSYNCQPQIIGQPISRSVSVGDTIGFSVAATGYGLRYQWYKDTAAIPMATKATYTIEGVTMEHAGNYFCRVSASRAVNSATANLGVSQLVGRRPSAISGLHIWVRDDFGFKYWPNAGQRCRSYAEESSCARGEDVATDDDDAVNDDDVNAEDDDNLDDEDLVVDNHDGCARFSYCRCDMNTAPQVFTMYLIFRGHASFQSIYQNSLFKVYGSCGGFFLRYESGAKVLLPLVKDSLSLLRISKTPQFLTVYVNGQKVDSIAGERILDYLPSLESTRYIDRCFSVSNTELAPWLWKGSLKEMLLYNRALTDSENNQILGYLLGYHGGGPYDLVHSENAYAPPFDPSIMEYVAAIPDATYSLLMGVLPDSTATIEGNPSPQTILLMENPHRIAAKVRSPLGPANYGLTVTRKPNHTIFVNDDASGADNGTSWADAYKDLQKALDDAGSNGKEIWVCEGTYKPSKRTIPSEPRSATFLIFAGTEVIGGFVGTESSRNPLGSPYRTILSGDLGGDDAGNAWPPISTTDLQKVDDNAYHVVTASGRSKTESIKLQGLRITGGRADGIGEKAVGAGIYDIKCSPTLLMCVVDRNYAASNGAGMYCESAAKLLKNCLFAFNYSKTGNGGGLYAGTGSLTIDASIFDQNTINAATSSKGGALYTSHTAMTIVNSVFTRNATQGDGGAIFADTSTITITNCTFAANAAAAGTGGITNRGTTSMVTNTILWQNQGAGIGCPGVSPCYADLSGTGFEVTYSCITNGFVGTGNIVVSDPRFVNIGNPTGPNGRYGDVDDGLRLAADSPLRDVASTVAAPQSDIILVKRPYGSAADIGAYEYEEYATQPNVLGRLIGGAFVPEGHLDMLDYLYHWKYIRMFSKCNYARVLRIAIPKNEYTDKKSQIYIYVRGTDSGGNPLPGDEVCIWLTRVSSDNSSHYYQSQTSTYGKSILFVNDPGYHNWENPWAYVVYANASASFSYRLPNSQF